MDNIDLYHHGIKGMKWGVRRTPAQLGHKPSANKKSGFSLFKKKQTATTEDKPKHKSSKDMTNDELQSSIRNMQLQMQYNQLKSQLEPQKKGKGFVKSFVDDSVKPAAIQAGKSVLTDYLTKMGKKYLGVDGDTIGALRKEVEGLELNVRKKNATETLNKKKDDEYDSAKRESEMAKFKADKAFQEDRRKKYEPKEEPKTESKSESKPKPDSGYESFKKNFYEQGKSVTSRLLNEGYNSTTKRPKQSSSDKPDVVIGDADWKDLGTSDYESNGRSYVDDLFD